MDAMVDKSRSVDGKPTSLLDLGYKHVGLVFADKLHSDHHATLVSMLALTFAALPVSVKSTGLEGRGLELLLPRQSRVLFTAIPTT